MDVRRGVPVVLASPEGSVPAEGSGPDVDQKNPGDVRPEGSGLDVDQKNPGDVRPEGRAPDLSVVPANPSGAHLGGKGHGHDVDPNQTVVDDLGNPEDHERALAAAEADVDPGSGQDGSAPAAAEAEDDPGPENQKRPARFESRLTAGSARRKARVNVGVEEDPWKRKHTALLPFCILNSIFP